MSTTLPAAIERLRQPIGGIIGTRTGADLVIPDDAADLIMSALPEILAKARLSTQLASDSISIGQTPRLGSRQRDQVIRKLRRAHSDAGKAVVLVARYINVPQMLGGRDMQVAGCRSILAWMDWLQLAIDVLNNHGGRKGVGRPADHLRRNELEHLSAWWHRQRPNKSEQPIPPGWPTRERGAFGKMLALIARADTLGHREFNRIKGEGASLRWIDEDWLTIAPAALPASRRRLELQSNIAVPVRPIGGSEARAALSTTLERPKFKSFREAAECIILRQMSEPSTELMHGF